MKCFPIICLGATFLLGFTSCTSIKQVNSQQNSDDVYYSLKDAKKDKKADQIRLAARQKQEEAQANQLKLEKETAAARANKGSEYYKEDFNYDDYYDDEYAARLRRFNHPANNCFTSWTNNQLLFQFRIRVNHQRTWLIWICL